jgi:predicted metal-dependent peptidase
MSEEQVYSELLKNKKPGDKSGKGAQGQGNGQDQGKGQGNGDPKCTGHGQVEDGQDTSAEGLAEQEQNWKQAILQAAQQASKYGKLPGFAQAMVDELKNPAIDWKAATRKFLETTAKNDYSWTRPNRRYVGQGLYLPSMHSEQLPPVVVLWDTSGSRWSNEQVRFAGSEIASIIQDARPEKTYVIACDSSIKGVQVFEQGDTIKLDAKGGGGTSFEPVFEWIEQNNVEPSCVIAITDLDGTFPDVAPSYPVLWVCDEVGKTAPFGEVLEVKLT